MDVRKAACLAALLMLLRTRSSAAPPIEVDLVVDLPTLASSWTVERRQITADSCTVAEGCVGGPGLRTLLRYDSLNVNISQNDLVLGDPNASNAFEFDACHGHYHLRDFNESQVLDLNGHVVAEGRKQDFCVADTSRVLDEPWVPAEGQFGSCDNQGLTRGFGDLYTRCLDCQWVDVTGLPPGDYQLRVTVNPRRHIRESSYQNNAATVPVVIPDLSGQADLIVDTRDAASSWVMDKIFFKSNSCEYQAGCIDGTGYRKLLRVEPRIANQGTGDLSIGTPAADPPSFTTGCAGEPQARDVAEYQLLDPQSGGVLMSRRLPVRLHDTDRYLDQPWMPRFPSYGSCATHSSGINPAAEQGISRGWADHGGLSLPCQWLDITDLPDGPYTLKIVVNPDGTIPESDTANNTALIPVTLGDPPGVPHRPHDALQLTSPTETGLIAVLYDVTHCPASSYNLYYGTAPPFSYVYTGAICSLGPTGLKLVDLPDPGPGTFLWMTVVGVEGTVEGGHGYDSQGRERPLTGVPFCGVTRSQPGSLCTP